MIDLSIVWLFFQFVMVHVVMWVAYKAFFGFYWNFICFGIEKGYIEEDIFARIDKMNKIASGMF